MELFKGQTENGKVEVKRGEDGLEIAYVNIRTGEETPLTLNIEKDGVRLNRNRLLIRDFGKWEGVHEKLEKRGIISEPVEETPYGPICKLKKERG